MKSTTNKQARKQRQAEQDELTIPVKLEAILPYLKTEPLDDESLGYNTGAVLRNASDEAFRAFVELICGCITEPAKLEEILTVCEIVARLRNSERGSDAPAFSWHSTGTLTAQ